MIGKIKLFFIKSGKGKRILDIAIIILVGMSSFLLGRLSKSDLRPGIEVEYPNTQISQKASAIEAVEPQKPSEKAYFASKKGKKYYPVGCSAGKSIKIGNRVYFNTGEEAEKAGYELSASCK